MGYDRSDSFPFELNGFPSGSKSKGKIKRKTGNKCSNNCKKLCFKSELVETIVVRYPLD